MTGIVATVSVRDVTLTIPSAQCVCAQGWSFHFFFSFYCGSDITMHCFRCIKVRERCAVLFIICEMIVVLVSCNSQKHDGVFIPFIPVTTGVRL